MQLSQQTNVQSGSKNPTVIKKECFATVINGWKLKFKSSSRKPATLPYQSGICQEQVSPQVQLLLLILLQEMLHQSCTLNVRHRPEKNHMILYLLPTPKCKHVQKIFYQQNFKNTELHYSILGPDLLNLAFGLNKFVNHLCSWFFRNVFLQDNKFQTFKWVVESELVWDTLWNHKVP